MSDLQPRRPQRRKHLDVSVLPVEQALLARATEIERENSPAEKTGPALLAVACEFRALAEELHWR